MYFNGKENTNIDGEFQGKKQFDIQKYKPLIVIGGGIIVLIIIIVVAFNLTKKKPTPTPPVTYNIELIGDTNVTITLNNDYIEAGYRATDSNGNDVTSEVVIDNGVKSNQVGNYQISYTIGTETKYRYIEIKEPMNDTYIYLKGDKNIYLNLNQEYQEPGYVAHDTIDGSLTDMVQVTGTVNPNVKGLYKIVYTVTNSREITTQVERNVIVGQDNPQ